MSNAVAWPFDEFHDEVEWVKSLARSMLRDDPVAAEDLAQQALLVALENPPPRRTTPRAWLRAVMWNLRNRSHRAETRRRRMMQLVEDAARLNEDHPGILVEEAEALTHMMEAVIDLESRSRQVVLMKWKEGLRFKDIGKILGETEVAVRTRHHRALKVLKKRLEKDYGDWRQPCIAVLGLPATLVPPAREAAEPTSPVAAPVTKGGSWLGQLPLLIGATVLLAAGASLLMLRPMEAGALGPEESEQEGQLGLAGREGSVDGREPMDTRSPVGAPGAGGVPGREPVDSPPSEEPSSDLTSEYAVRILTEGPGERSLEDAVREEAPHLEPLLGRMFVVATRLPMDALPLVEATSPLRFGAGEYFVRSRSPGVVPAGHHGLLRVRPPPREQAWWASLVFGDRVIASQPLDGRLEPLVFRVPLDPWRASLADMRFRLVHAGSRNWMVLSDRERQLTEFRLRGVSDALPGGLGPTGLVEFGEVPPGRHFLEVFVPGYGLEQRWIQVGVGELSDLGEIELGPARSVRGSLEDEKGNRVPGTIMTLVPIPADDSYVPLHRGLTAATDAQGRFEFTQAAVGSYVLKPSYPPHVASAAVSVDTRLGDVTDLVVVLQPSIRVTLVPSWGEREVRIVTVRTESSPQLPVFSAPVWGLGKKDIYLPGGDYLVEIYIDGEGWRRLGEAVHLRGQPVTVTLTVD